MKLYFIVLLCLLTLNIYGFGQEMSVERGLLASIEEQDNSSSSSSTEHAHSEEHAGEKGEDVDHLTEMNFLWVAVGLIILLLFEILKSKKKWGKQWIASSYFRNNIVQFLLAIISSYVMFYFADWFTEEALGLHVHDDKINYYSWFALACGFNGHILVEKLATAFKKRAVPNEDI